MTFLRLSTTPPPRSPTSDGLATSRSAGRAEDLARSRAPPSIPPASGPLPSRVWRPRTPTSTGPREWVQRTSKSSGSRRRGGPEYESLMESAGEAIATTTVDNLYDLFGGLFCDADREALSDDDRTARRGRIVCLRVWRRVARGLRRQRGDHGSLGIRRHRHRTARPPLLRRRRLVRSSAHGAWLSSHVPGAVTHRHKDEGHVSIYVEYADELAEVISNLSA